MRCSRMTGSVEPAIFISYAHADGQKFARDLRDRLLAETPPLPSIWLDREEMEGGIGWWGQITRALERSRFAVLVMTEAAAESKTVRREWRHARRKGAASTR